MNTVSTLRLYVLRAAYLVIFIGLALMIGPLLFTAHEAEHMRGVVRAMLAAVALLALLGIRYPLQMLPLLLFEFVWKSVWLIAVGIPLRGTDAFTGGIAQTWVDCTVGVVVCLIAIPWGYVYHNFVRKPGDPWRRGESVDRPAVARSATPA